MTGRESQVHWRVNELSSSEQLARCEELQRAVWAFSDLELMPAVHARALVLGGGLVAGAWEGERLIGFALGFPAYRPEKSPHVGFHSDMAAVLPEYRDQGVGRTLKRFQRRWCLERGMRWMQWTFDPLRAGNARFNLEHLGAACSEYLPNLYGRVENALNPGLPSDRLVAYWDLESPAVERLASGIPRPQPAEVSEAVLERRSDGRPAAPRLGSSARFLSVAVPEDASRMLKQDPEGALEWRMALREVLESYFRRGYAATRFPDGSYLLEKGS